jgi:hypothetical protein
MVFELSPFLPALTGRTNELDSFSGGGCPGLYLVGLSARSSVVYRSLIPKSSSIPGTTISANLRAPKIAKQ